MSFWVTAWYAATITIITVAATKICERGLPFDLKIADDFLAIQHYNCTFLGKSQSFKSFGKRVSQILFSSSQTRFIDHLSSNDDMSLDPP